MPNSTTRSRPIFAALLVATLGAAGSASPAFAQPVQDPSTIGGKKPDAKASHHGKQEPVGQHSPTNTPANTPASASANTPTDLFEGNPAHRGDGRADTREKVSPEARSTGEKANDQGHRTR